MTKNYNFCINFIKMLSNILKIKLIFGDFVIQCRLSMSFNAGLSITRNWFWVHIWRRFNILKCCAALMHGLAWYNHRLYYTYMHNITCDIMHCYMIRLSLYGTGTTELFVYYYVIGQQWLSRFIWPNTRPRMTSFIEYCLHILYREAHLSTHLRTKL